MAKKTWNKKELKEFKQLIEDKIERDKNKYDTSSRCIRKYRVSNHINTIKP